ncbi:MAG: acyltransferase family protein [Nitrospirota bacterium]
MLSPSSHPTPPAAAQYDLTRPSYRADIDGLRAIAVLSVVGFHAFPDLVPGGFVGVDVFFIISGFLISSILFAGLAGDRFSFMEFYSRRIKRIFPALVLVLFATFVFGWFALLPDEYKPLGKHIAAGAGFVSNFALWSEAGYFDTSAATKPLLHLWSLGIEEQFYILWPLVLYLAWTSRLGFLSVTLLILAASFAINLTTVDGDRVAAFYSPLCRFWELLLGSTLAYLASRRTVVPASTRNAQSMIGAAFLAVTLFAIDDKTAFPGWWALLPTIGAVLIIASGPGAWINRAILSRPVLVWFGLISYPLYLWHWPLLSFKHIVKHGVPSVLSRISLIALSILLAWLTYRYLETNVRFRRQGTVTVALILLCGVLLGFGALTWRETIAPRHDDNRLKTILLALDDWDHPPKAFSALEYQGQTFFIRRAAGPTVLFLGDSTMEQYGPRIDQVISERPHLSKSAIFATAGGCPPIPHIGTPTHRHCQPRLEAAVALALGNEIDTVVLGACWWCYFVQWIKPEDHSHEEYFFDQAGREEFLKGGNGVDLALDSFLRLLQLLASHEKRVVLVLNTPAGQTLHPKNLFNGSRFGQIRYEETAGIARSDFERDYGPIKDRLTAMARGSGATVIDPLDFLCSEGVCSALMPDGTPMYRDDTHLRASYARNHVRFLDGSIHLDARLDATSND